VPPLASPSRAARRIVAASALLAAASLGSGCAFVDTYFPRARSLGVYQIDINQGNYLSQDMVDKLKVGQTPTQVRQLLGTPLLVSPFRPDRWDYVYEFTHQGQTVEHRKLTLYFVDDKLARWEGDEMPASVAELNRVAASRTANEAAWLDERSWWQKLLDVFKK
jgi:outer membrane protein assembly factor BamE